MSGEGVPAHSHVADEGSSAGVCGGSGGIVPAHKSSGDSQAAACSCTVVLVKVFLGSSGSFCGGIGDAKLNSVWILNRWVSVSCGAHGTEEEGLSSSLADNFP